MDVVSTNSDLYSASITAMLCAISRYNGPRYNGTQLYMFGLQGLIKLMVGNYQLHTL